MKIIPKNFSDFSQSHDMFLFVEITKKTKMGALFRSVKLEIHVLR